MWRDSGENLQLFLNGLSQLTDSGLNALGELTVVFVQVPQKTGQWFWKTRDYKTTNSSWYLHVYTRTELGGQPINTGITTYLVIALFIHAFRCLIIAGLSEDEPNAKNMAKLKLAELNHSGFSLMLCREIRRGVGDTGVAADPFQVGWAAAAGDSGSWVAWAGACGTVQGWSSPWRPAGWRTPRTDTEAPPLHRQLMKRWKTKNWQ